MVRTSCRSAFEGRFGGSRRLYASHMIEMYNRALISSRMAPADLNTLSEGEEQHVGSVVQKVNASNTVPTPLMAA